MNALKRCVAIAVTGVSAAVTFTVPATAGAAEPVPCFKEQLAYLEAPAQTAMARTTVEESAAKVDGLRQEADEAGSRSGKAYTFAYYGWPKEKRPEYMKEYEAAKKAEEAAKAKLAAAEAEHAKFSAEQDKKIAEGATNETSTFDAFKTCLAAHSS